MTNLEAAKYVLKKLIDNNFEAYFVGGFVRDRILNLTPNDIDITTSASPNEIKKIFDYTYDKGIKYGTVLVMIEGYGFEVTQYRSDSDYEDYRHPKITSTTELSLDLKRRDFTINAMAMDKDFNVTDLFGGLTDLKNKIIKAVGDPNIRFHEDALRMLRAFYFASKLDFDIESKTLEGINKNASLIKKISSERVYEELNKLILTKYSNKGFHLLNQSLLKEYLPSLKSAIEFIDGNNIQIKDINELLIMGFYFDGDNYEYYKLSNRDKKVINKGLKVIKEIDKLDLSLYELTKAELIYYYDIAYKLHLTYKLKDEILDFYNSLSIHNKNELTVKPSNFKEIVKKDEGKWIKELENEIIYAILKKEIRNNKEDIINYIKNKEDIHG